MTGCYESAAATTSLPQQQVLAQARMGRSEGMLTGPEGGGAVKEIEGAVAKRGLPVDAPGRLLSIAVALRVARPCGVAISLRRSLQ